MKRWGFLTVLCYLLILTALAAPLIFVCMARQSGAGDLREFWLECFGIYKHWGFWVWLTVLGLGQAFLLTLPMGMAQRRLKARRPLVVPALVSSFFIANLFLAGLMSILCVLFKDNAFEVFGYLGEAAWSDPLKNAFGARLFGSPVGTGNATLDYLGGMVLAVAGLWTIWGLIFYRFARKDEAEGLLHRTTRWLLHGSILELLVAVPSHILIRQRQDCCAPMGSFWGITTGLAVMLLSFGPGVFFLFAKRMGKLKVADSAAA